MFYTLEKYDKAFADFGFLSHRLMSPYDSDSKLKCTNAIQKT